jgi:hypothetical protein
MTSTRAELIAALEQTTSELTRLTTDLSDEALDFHAGLAEWSIREILAHLVDDEMYVMRLRMERIIKEANPHLTPHDERAWYASRNTTRDQLSELLADFGLQRAASLSMLKMLRESDWARPGYQPEYGSFTAEGWLSNWAEHDTVHLRQIESALQAYKATTNVS